MSTIEGQVYRLLAQDSTLGSLLAQWNNTPAIFHEFAPQDTQAGWPGDFREDEYPSIRYSIDREEIPDRGVAGRLTIVVWGMRNDARKRPLPIAERVREVLHMATFHCDDGVAGLRWLTWNSRAPINTVNDQVLAAIMVFDLMIFGVQPTFAPDPIVALNEFTAGVAPELQVNPEIWVPSNDRPAVYWRFVDERHRLHVHIATWMVGTFFGHVLAPKVDVRRYWSRKILSNLMTNRTLIMRPPEPPHNRLLTVIDGAEVFDADPLRVGTIRISCDYITYNIDPRVPPLVENIYTELVIGSAPPV